MKIGLVQWHIVWENPRENQEKIRALVENLPEKLDWLIFPEMTLTGFSLKKRNKEDSGDEFFSSLAKANNCWVTYGKVEARYNVCVTLNRAGKQVASYCKRHLFSLLGENRYHLAGKKLVSFLLDGFRVSPAICYDLRFPAQFFQQGEKTDIFLIIAHWPLARIDHWLTLLKARAIENLCYVVGVNPMGMSPQGQAGGHSLVVDPEGKIVMDASRKEGIFITTIDKELVWETRKKWPFLKDRHR
ncbi:MAG: carbon-nitrogen family hydrolase [Candidatus Omnitrophica bacterium]|nr:carbon-nitrogen family hydrolase [Candidatus Omnitrophota bacterium]